jgi:miniconductance mechanosensitive channel
MNQKLKFFFDLKEVFQNWGLSTQQSNTLNIVIGFLVILLLAYLSDIFVKWIIKIVLVRLVAKTKTVWDDILLEKRVFDRLSHLAPAIVLWYSAGHVLAGYEKTGNAIQVLLTIYMIIVSAMVVSSFMKGLNDIYQTFPNSAGKSIKGYIQIVILIVYCIAIILIISVITGSSPKALLTGLGAATAILMLIFKDAILGLVAGIQLSANDMLRIGDRITLPEYKTDGNVMEISLTTVKVMNFDNTVSTIPPYKLISESFINWRTMVESGGRRFNKYINIDVRTVAFAKPELLNRLKKFSYLKTLLQELQADVGIDPAHDPGKERPEIVFDRTRVTNLLLFRKYTESLLRHHPLIRKDMTIAVYQRQPGETGIPVELLAYSSEIDWKLYEDMQGEILDHLYAVIQEFDLKIFQRPTGDDFRK